VVRSPGNKSWKWIARGRNIAVNLQNHVSLLHSDARLIIIIGLRRGATSRIHNPAMTP
jgi:hypothetical protein